ncbi:MAG: nicotinamide mononucleotide transporter [Synergistaceae bacterium]|nr:nicotinamide mononucleotide transporter [Synergistaceae bacterium]
MINFVSAVCGIFCVFLTAKASISNFIFAVINTFVYSVYLFYWRIYGTFFLEVAFYLPVEIVSWVLWSRHRDDIDHEKTKARKLSITQNLLTAVVVGTVGISAHYVLVGMNGTAAWLDAFTLAIGIVAVILELFRYKEQYVWWIITDIITVALYIVHFDAVYLTKRVIYLIVALAGLRNWHILNKERNALNV